MFSLMPRKRERTPGTGVIERDPLRRMRREFETLFDRMFDGWPFAVSEFAPAAAWGLDLNDAGKEFLVRVEAHGFDAKEFEINLGGNLLTITAAHKEEKKDGEETYEESRFERSVMLPADVDPVKVEARYHNGVLELHLPNTPEAVGRKIEVKT